MSWFAKLFTPQKGDLGVAPFMEHAGWTQEPWSILWGCLEACTGVTPKPWSFSSPTELMKYWVQFVKTSYTQKSQRLIHIGRMAGALLFAYKIAIGRMEDLEKQLEHLSTELQETKATPIVQQQALLTAANQCSIMEQKCATVAEKFAVCAARRRKGKTHKGKDKGPRVRAIVIDPGWDPETWDGNIWSSSGSDSEQEDIERDREEAPSGPVKATLVVRRRGAMDPVMGRWARVDTMEDFTPEDIKNLINRYSQRPGEKPQQWLVRLIEEGADSVVIDRVGSVRFIGLTGDPYVYDALHHVPEGQNFSLVTVIANGFSDRHTNDGAWPPTSNQWVTLQQVIFLLKEEGMKLAIQFGNPETYLDQPFKPNTHDMLLEGCPSQWRPYLIPILMTTQGNPTQEVIEKLGQLGDLPGLPACPEQFETQGGTKLRKEVPARDKRELLEHYHLFKLLLQHGIPRSEIDGMPLSALRKMMQTGKSGGRVRSVTQRETGVNLVPAFGAMEPRYPWKDVDKALAQFHPKAE
ncbi:hypothetical protein BTVI_116104 [Pitangus sulphuratus]|nr:hypothetical protein BTVI_116104 [Pitangus sulphuratus]